jgi:hypothetical protein
LLYHLCVLPPPSIKRFDAADKGKDFDKVIKEVKKEKKN